MTTHSLLAAIEWPAARVTAQRSSTSAGELPARLTRYRGGTYSSTVDTVVFTDGTSARTDLIRLNPNIAGYSLDIAGIAPNLPSGYAVTDWLSVANLRARTREPQAAWMLANSYPSLSIAELSRRMRAHGYLGKANIKDHEAIAGTQAAIWYLTNGVELDTAARNLPTAVRGADGPTARTRLDARAHVVEFEFAERPQLGGYVVSAGAAQSSATMRLHASNDGVQWRAVSSSELTVDDGAARYTKPLGVGATVAETRHGAEDLGYRYYRLEIESEATVDIEAVEFWLHDARHHRNPDRVVQLYRYLLERSQVAVRRPRRAAVDDSQAVLAAGLIGPFLIDSERPVQVSVSDNATVMDITGTVLSGPVPPGTRFYVRPADSDDAVTVSVTDHTSTARVLVGVSAGPLTPLALVIPGTHELDEFTVEWTVDSDLSQVV